MKRTDHFLLILASQLTCGAPCKYVGSVGPLPLFQLVIPVHSWPTMDTSPLKNLLVGRLMPEKCYEELFVRLHLHAPCLKFVLNKIVGFWIILDTFLAQFPQLLKLLWRGSAEGLSLTAFLLQLYALSCPVVYAAANNFPFFAWAERLFTLAQTATIIFLILHYRGETLKGMLLLLSFGGVILLLVSFAAAAVVRVMYASTPAAFILSKVVQTVTNHQKGHTGQLSSLSALLSCAGALGAAVVSAQESGGSLTTLCHILSTCLSFILMSQIACYKRSAGSAAKKMD
ncbi:PREDICTED: mannose-P-dolichol utilization defect 1 protein-like [Poecilia mexicana]|uniref:mannose-P-dolichol utilization defect 1 protein-like n=1 Tax=Poecilia mexicana TaxID=48701 RepID=UPI00072E505D|nr:PREDICTED: mannose-P-dolichol utilization defect 1 protein-like [Poecilia mexicana]